LKEYKDSLHNYVRKNITISIMCILEIKLLENFVVPLGGHTFD